ncbi:uncharacterized protein BDR25DRAFT_359143 [Lindgomyces ingoldianus]|uniref:Uncharacterized protein n=1 Tax=Lindgomyces ingoldianus TaxID=673940 RepID=A0ACB6QJS4_9PLEO|nr:uncharacterized protein BDR25DRAFT_359143 [Lindgomyces ingoldianus]KAF2467117.1 hypothetical protein BDR25DRAFT_359143 [Lindgomyces ingoldianus]
MITATELRFQAPRPNIHSLRRFGSRCAQPLKKLLSPSNQSIRLQARCFAGTSRLCFGTCSSLRGRVSPARRSGYSRSYRSMKDVAVNVEPCFELSDLVGSFPWIVSMGMTRKCKAPCCGYQPMLNDWGKVPLNRRQDGKSHTYYTLTSGIEAKNKECLVRGRRLNSADILLSTGLRGDRYSRLG